MGIRTWAVVLWAATVVLVVVARNDLRAAEAFSDRGQTATATLTAIEDRGRQNDAYRVAFTTADGRAVNATLWDLPADPRPDVGGTLPVVYDPADPALVRDARPDRFAGHRLMLGLALLTGLTAVLLTGLAVLLAVRRARRSGSAGPSTTT